MTKSDLDDVVDARADILLQALLNSPLRGQADELVRKIHNLTQAQIDQALRKHK